MNEEECRLVGERMEMLKTAREHSRRLVDAIQGEGLHDIGPEFIAGEADRIARLDQEITRCEALLEAVRT